MIEKVKSFFINLIKTVKEKLTPAKAAVILSAAVVIIGIVVFCVNRIGIKKASPFDNMPVQIVTFHKAQDDTDDTDDPEGPDEEESFLSGRVENDIIKNAEKNKVLASPCILEYSEENGFGYLNNCVFLGDSRTVGMVNYKCVSDEDALAKVGLMHTDAAKTTFTQNSGKSYTVRQFLQAKKSDVVYVCYGVNGMDSIPEEKYEETYTNLVDDIIGWAKGSTVVLMAIWPVDDNGVYKGKVKNEWIDKYNDFLMKLAEEKNIKYLDINTVLKDDKGSIKAEYDGGDGLHYSAYAYGIILDYIVTHPVPGVSCEGEYKVHYVKPKGGGNKIPKAPAATPVVTPAVPEVTDPSLLQPVPEVPQISPEEEEKKKQEEEEEQRRQQEEEERRKKEEEEKKKQEEEQKRKQEEEKKKKEEEERKRQEEEEEQRRQQEEEERRRQEEEDQKRREEEERRRQEEEEEQRRRQEEEEERRRQEEQNPPEGASQEQQ